MNNCTGKLDYLNSVETPETFKPEINYNKKSYLANFPYPYMNGKLHLGHLFTFSKLDFISYFKKQQGYEVLLPFGYHCTGMPISASAYKLRQELDGKEVDVSVKDILKGIGFTNYEDFTNPLHWIRTFPAYAEAALKTFHSSIDWRDSFITTDINPYYDSFVQYQFRKLKRLGYLNFGKRYSIFCPINEQACLDHDRRRGEGLKPVDVILQKVDLGDKILLVRAKKYSEVTKVVISSNKMLCVFSYKKKVYVLEDDLFNNLKHQTDDVFLLENICGKDVKSDKVKIDYVEVVINTKIVSPKEEGRINTTNNISYDNIVKSNNEEMVLIENDDFVKMSEPESEIISRAGAKCVVSLMDQWYIDYSNEEWKKKARLCFEKMKIPDDTRAKILDAVEWINKWGFSRSFGLGTRIPWEPQYLIDSLSDSTIYYAFYTFKHLMFTDLEGKEQIFPASLLCDEVFEYIFEDIDEIPERLKDHEGILKECRKRFQYFYPVDILTSGKDLIGNHLIFFVFNHVALFDEKYWPRGIYSNGHLMLNSAKMSKSDGNYMTVEEALKKYGASATRMCLADCGDTNEDANFLEATANSMVLKLYTLVKTVEGLDVDQFADITKSFENLSLKNDYSTFIDDLILQYFSKNIVMCLESHESMVYRDVLKYGFYENLRLIELYNILKGNNKKLISYFYKTILQLMYPIIPSLSSYLINLKFNSEIAIPKILNEADDKIKIFNFIKDVCTRINSSKKNNTHVDILVGRNFKDWKVECMKIVDACSDKNEICSKFDELYEKLGIDKKKGMIFCMDYFKYTQKYMITFDEFAMLDLFSDYISSCCAVEVNILKNDSFEPLSPGFKFY